MQDMLEWIKLLSQQTRLNKENHFIEQAEDMISKATYLQARCAPYPGASRVCGGVCARACAVECVRACACGIVCVPKTHLSGVQIG